jgi:hypothetical protein
VPLDDTNTMFIEFRHVSEMAGRLLLGLEPLRWLF